MCVLNCVTKTVFSSVTPLACNRTDGTHGSHQDGSIQPRCVAYSFQTLFDTVIITVLTKIRHRSIRNFSFKKNYISSG